jgi:hypothetical protein
LGWGWYDTGRAVPDTAVSVEFGVVLLSSSPPHLHLTALCLSCLISYLEEVSGTASPLVAAARRHCRDGCVGEKKLLEAQLDTLIRLLGGQYQQTLPI